MEFVNVQRVSLADQQVMYSAPCVIGQAFDGPLASVSAYAPRIQFVVVTCILTIDCTYYRLLAHLGVPAAALNGFRVALGHYLSSDPLPDYVRGRVYALRPNALKAWKLNAFAQTLKAAALSDVQPMGGEFMLAVSMLIIKRQIVVVNAGNGQSRNLFTTVFLPTDTDVLATDLRRQPRDQWLLLSTSDPNMSDAIWRTLHPAAWRLATTTDQQSEAGTLLASMQATVTEQLISVGCSGTVKWLPSMRLHVVRSHPSWFVFAACLNSCCRTNMYEKHDDRCHETCRWSPSWPCPCGPFIRKWPRGSSCTYDGGCACCIAHRH